MSARLKNGFRGSKRGDAVALFTRRLSPPKFNDYTKYRSFLRADFREMCAYCERPELAAGGEDSFEIDHFRPKALSSPDLETDYQNLYYSCHKCNRHKGVKWPSDALLAEGFRFADPCREDMYAEHLQEDGEAGKLLPLSNCGRYTCDHIKLNRPALLTWRQGRRGAASDLRILESTVTDFQFLLASEDRPELQKQIESKIEAIRSKINLCRQLYSL